MYTTKWKKKFLEGAYRFGAQSSQTKQATCRDIHEETDSFVPAYFHETRYRGGYLPAQAMPVHPTNRPLVGSLGSQNSYIIVRERPLLARTAISQNENPICHHRPCVPTSVSLPDVLSPCVPPDVPSSVCPCPCVIVQCARVCGVGVPRPSPVTINPQL